MTPSHFSLMADYNRWMNDKLYGLAATLSDEARKRDRGAFFKSIHGTLNHLLLADSVWLARFTADQGVLPRDAGANVLLHTIAHRQHRDQRSRTDDDAQRGGRGRRLHALPRRLHAVGDGR